MGLSTRVHDTVLLSNLESITLSSEIHLTSTENLKSVSKVILTISFTYNQGSTKTGEARPSQYDVKIVGQVQVKVKLRRAS